MRSVAPPYPHKAALCGGPITVLMGLFCIYSISTSYKYNDNGIRTYKQVTQGGSTTTYKYNLMGSSITYEERTGANVCEMYYAYDNNGRLYGFYYDGASNDGFYYFKRNIQGDIIGILNSSGTEVVTYEYDSWGKLESTTGTLAASVGADNPFRYRGYYYDTETGLYYLNQRYYNPEWGRFINADAVLGSQGDLLGHNVFAYCQNNPVMHSDPSGMLMDVDFDTWFDSYYTKVKARSIADDLVLPQAQLDVIYQTMLEAGWQNVHITSGGNISIATGGTWYMQYVAPQNVENYVFGVGEILDSVNFQTIIGESGMGSFLAIWGGETPQGVVGLMAGFAAGTGLLNHTLNKHLRYFNHFNSIKNGYGGIYSMSTSIIASGGKPFRYYDCR